MKLFLAALAACALALTAQDNSAGQLKHLPIPTSHGRPVSVAALEIERGAEYPTTVHLKGSVEIRMPVCVNQPAGQVCAGDMVLRAEEADFHEETGQIEARGSVKVSREN